MTAGEYRTCLRALGLTPMKPSYEGSTLHQDGEGFVYSIPDAETMSMDERKAFLSLLKARMGVSDH